MQSQWKLMQSQWKLHAIAMQIACNGNGNYMQLQCKSHVIAIQIACNCKTAIAWQPQLEFNAIKILTTSNSKKMKM